MKMNRHQRRILKRQLRRGEGIDPDVVDMVTKLMQAQEEVGQIPIVDAEESFKADVEKECQAHNNNLSELLLNQPKSQEVIEF